MSVSCNCKASSVCFEMLQLCSAAKMLLLSFPGVAEIPCMDPFICLLYPREITEQYCEGLLVLFFFRKGKELIFIRTVCV